MHIAIMGSVQRRTVDEEFLSLMPASNLVPPTVKAMADSNLPAMPKMTSAMNNTRERDTDSVHE